MGEFLLIQVEYIFRIILSGICGGLIGYERKSRGKGAGIRTHLVVALASALMMVVSKYGFSDLLMEGRSGDGSRIASQIVSGVGFLGAGMIYFSKNMPKGLTTAAGIWATAGIGMAIGAGMYVVGLLSAGIIIFSQVVLHRNFKVLQVPNEERLNVVIENSDEAIEHIKKLFEQHDIIVEQLNFKKISENKIELIVDVSISQSYEMIELLDFARNDRYIQSVSMN